MIKYTQHKIYHVIISQDGSCLEETPSWWHFWLYPFFPVPSTNNCPPTHIHTETSHRPSSGMSPSFWSQTLDFCSSAGDTKEAAFQHNLSSCEQWVPQSLDLVGFPCSPLQSCTGLWKFLLIRQYGTLRTPYILEVSSIAGCTLYWTCNRKGFSWSFKY